MFFLFIYLKLDSGYICLHFVVGADDEFRENYFFTNYELSANVRVS
jgi:hypothetical protein